MLQIRLKVLYSSPINMLYFSGSYKDTKEYGDRLWWCQKLTINYGYLLLVS